MIDLHSHLLYSVDDGASSLTESLALARMAVDDGIHTVVLTPHLHPGRWDNRRSSLASRVAVFREELAEAGIPLNVHLGGEVRIGHEALELLLMDEVPFYGEVDGFRVMLTEFPHQMMPVGSLQFVQKLLSMRIRPLIAHPERNKAVMHDPEKIRPFVDSGCWLQLTAGSLVGEFGEVAERTARYLLAEDLVHVLASDAHNAVHRPPVLSPGLAVAAEVVGEVSARRLVVDHPARILGLA